MRLLRLFIPILSLILVPELARANTVVPSIAALIPPVWITLPQISGFVSAFFLFTAIVLVETAVLALAFRQPWVPTLRLVFKANLITTFMGAMLVGSKIIGLLVLCIALWHANKSIAALKWKKVLRILFLILFTTITLLIAFIDQTTVPRMIAQFYATMLYSLMVTLFFEGLYFASKAGRIQTWRWSLAANGTSYFLLFAILLASGFRSSGLVFTLEGPRYQLARSGNSDHREVIRRFEEMFLWEESTDRRKENDYMDCPFAELGLVERWAEAGYISDAKDLYAVIATHRPRHIDGPGAESYDDFWKKAEAAIK